MLRIPTTTKTITMLQMSINDTTTTPVDVNQLQKNAPYAVEPTERKIVQVCININQVTVLLGYLTKDQHYIPINALLLITKYYIFACAQRQKWPNIIELQNKIQKIYSEQELKAIVNLSIDKFRR